MIEAKESLAKLYNELVENIKKLQRNKKETIAMLKLLVYIKIYISIKQQIDIVVNKRKNWRDSWGKRWEEYEYKLDYSNIKVVQAVKTILEKDNSRF